MQRLNGSGCHEIWLADTNGEHRRRLARMGDAGGGICAHPSFTSDSKAVLFQSAGAKAWEIWRADLTTGRLTRILPDAAEPDCSTN
jgi:Tol biopolymer transport system component